MAEQQRFFSKVCNFASSAVEQGSSSGECRTKRTKRNPRGDNTCSNGDEEVASMLHRLLTDHSKNMKRTGAKLLLEDQQALSSFDPVYNNKTDTGESGAIYCSYQEQTTYRDEERDYFSREKEPVIEGMAEPHDTKRLFETTRQNFTGPNGVITYSGLKLDEFISNLVNALKVGEHSHLTFLAREIYLLKSLKIPVNQHESELLNVSTFKIRNAIMHYIVYNLDERNTELLLYIFYNLAYFFSVEKTSLVEKGKLREEGSGDIEFITRALIAIRMCPIRSLDAKCCSSVARTLTKYNVEGLQSDALTTVNNDEEEEEEEEEDDRATPYTSDNHASNILWASGDNDDDATRYMVSRIFNKSRPNIHGSTNIGPNNPVRLEEESFPPPKDALVNPDVYFNDKALNADSNAREVWVQLSVLASDYDKIMKGIMNRSLSDEMEVAVETLRLFYQSTFYTSNSTSKVAILCFACVFVNKAIHKRSLITLEQGAEELTAEQSVASARRRDSTYDYDLNVIKRLSSSKKDGAFDYTKDHLYFPTGERYEVVASYSFDREMVPQSSHNTYVADEEYPGLIDKINGRGEHQIKYHHGEDKQQRPCSPTSALHKFAINVGASNYSEQTDNLLALSCNDHNNSLKGPGDTVLNLEGEETASQHPFLGWERYAFGHKEGVVKRFRGTTPRGKFGLDCVFIHQVKANLGMSTPHGDCNLNMFRRKDVYLGTEGHRRTMSSYNLMVESGVPGHYSTDDRRNENLIRNCSAKANYNLFYGRVRGSSVQRMRFLSLILLRAVLGVRKKLTLQDIHLHQNGPTGENEVYITIEDEEGVGEMTCEQVFENCREFINMCMPVTKEDLYLLPPWCRDIFTDFDVTLRGIKKKPEYMRPNTTREESLSGGKDIFRTRRVKDNVRSAFRFSDMSVVLHNMTVFNMHDLSREEVSRRMNVDKFKSARKAECDRFVDSNNAKARAAYAATVQNPILYNTVNSDVDSSPLRNPFVPIGEKSFVKRRSQRQQPPLAGGEHPYDQYRRELGKYVQYNSDCKEMRRRRGGVDDSVDTDSCSPRSSDDECVDKDDGVIEMTRKSVLKGVKASITEASITTQFFLFERLMRRIFKNLNRLTGAAYFFHNIE